MDSTGLFESLKLLLAVWGAGLSTYLAIRQARERKRQVRVFLTYISWVEQVEMAVVNVGHRPVTITEVGVRPLPPADVMDEYAFKPLGLEYSDQLGSDESSPLPVVLKDGEQARFIMESQVMNLIHHGGRMQGYSWVAYARDAEHREYTTTTYGEFDVKWGVHSDRA